MHIPEYLKKGDTVGILSTARKFTKEQLNFTLDLLEDWGLKVVIGQSIDAEQHQFAGDDATRLQNLQDFIDDPKISAILCARGGYGTMRIVDDLKLDNLKKNPKWICGFSDVTVLHEHLQNMGIASIHSAMPSLFPSDKNHPTLTSLKNALFGNELSYTWDNSISNINLNNIEAEIIGGNLSLVYALQGSKSDINTDGKILFLEDLDEYFYHIDRMFCSLDRSGKLKNLKGLLIGGMSDMKDNSIPFGMNTEEIILHYTSKYNYPVIFNFPCGHIEHNYAVKLGMKARIEVDETKLRFTQH